MTTRSRKPPAAAEIARRNVQDLARVMVTEAGGESEAAQVAVGWCLRNRMIRNGTKDVERVWRPAFQHSKAATAQSLTDAASILAGTLADPTGGATHFYTPDAMPKEGDETDGIDVDGGLESVPGVMRNGRPIRNYAPGFIAFTPNPSRTCQRRSLNSISSPVAAMSAKTVIILAATMVFKCSGISAAPIPDLKNIPPTIDGIHAAARRVKGAGCATAQCQAATSIDTVLQIDLDAAASTNGVPRSIPANRDQMATRAMHRAVLQYPGRFAAICELSAEIMSRYDPPSQAGDRFVPISLLRLALDMDQLVAGRCLPSLLSRLPQTQAAREVIDTARTLCRNDRAHNPSACQAIDRH